MSTGSLAGKIVVVLGASSGYGLASAQQLVRAGATVLMAAHHSNSFEGLEIPNATGKAVLVHTDVRDASAVQSLAAQTVRDFGRIDAWVNAASFASRSHFTTATIDSQLDVIQTDLVGSLFGSRAAIQQFLLQQTGGVLINVAADPDSLGLPYMAAYAAAKYGVVGLGIALRAEAKAEKWSDIHICTVMPGDFAEDNLDTPAPTEETSGPPKAQAAVLDDTADAITRLVTTPKDTVKVHGTHYFL